MYIFVALFLFFIIRAEHSRPSAISFGVFSSMLLVPQWITICLIAGGNSSFSARHNKFSTLSPRIPQFNVSFPKNEFQTFLYLGSPWIIEPPSNIVCMFLFVFNTDRCCWYNLCHPYLQNRLTGVDVCDYQEVTFRQFAVIVWFVFPFDTVLYGV